MFTVIILQHFESQRKPLMIAPRTQDTDQWCGVNTHTHKKMTCLPSNFYLTSLTYKTEYTSQGDHHKLKQTSLLCLSLTT